MKILLTGEIRAPGRRAVSAVVPGAEAAHALRILGCLHERMAPGGSGDVHRRVGRDLAVVVRVFDDRPFAFLPGDLHHRHPVRRLALSHVVCGRGLSPALAAVDDVHVHVFVVDGEDVLAPGLEERHAVVVVAEGEFLARARAARRVVELGSSRPHGVSPPGDDVPVVALGRGDRIERIGGRGLEAEAVRTGKGGERVDAARAHDERRRGERCAPAQEPTPGYHLVHQLFKIGRLRPRIVDLVELIRREFLMRGELRVARSVFVHLSSPTF